MPANKNRSWSEIESQVSASSLKKQFGLAGVLGRSLHFDHLVSVQFYFFDFDERSCRWLEPRDLKLIKESVLSDMLEGYEILQQFSMSNANGKYFNYRYYNFTPAYEALFEINVLKPILSQVLPRIPLFKSKNDLIDAVKNRAHEPLQLVEGEQLCLSVTPTETGYELTGEFRVGSKNIPLMKLNPFVANHLFVYDNLLISVNFNSENKKWWQLLSDSNLIIKREEVGGFLENLHNQALAVDLPEELQYPDLALEPEFRLHLGPDKSLKNSNKRFIVRPEFQYGNRRVSSHDQQLFFIDQAKQCRFKRDLAKEEILQQKVSRELITFKRIEGRFEMTLDAIHLYTFVNQVVEQGVEVEVERKKLSTRELMRFDVKTGQDWFEVTAEAEISGLWVKIPQILESINKGETFVSLGNGQVGMISDNMKKKLLKWSQLGDISESGFRFGANQGFILNSLLDEEESVTLDQRFKDLKDKILQFQGVRSLAPTKNFKGELRSYQQEGLGWLNFLKDFGLGGVLADDMGLGKTIQCLAFLDHLFQKNKKAQFLVVAPKSLMGNWLEESAKFTPHLKSLVLSGQNRSKDLKSFAQYNLIITTYQTMVRDIQVLKDLNWEAIILDEAQAIKNSSTLAARSSRLLNSSFKLAMTGTPIENSIQDLFSISEFVNPGFLHKKIRSAHLTIAEDIKQLIHKSFKPVVLRRTKEQVLKDLPSKTEQTIMIDLEGDHLKVYNELKAYYKVHLLQKVKQEGLPQNKIEVLSALTRLRQAALHPRIIDNKRDIESSKFTVALEMLQEIVSENHKVLVYSQFTTLLKLFKEELDKLNIAYTYLDGASQNRTQIVNTFKKSETIPVFLISLKAGGTGLNLIEADYVFLLDPWWNPAAESQAIDRIHRIGQTRPVNAYRFISKNTVEEKILDLQKAKRDLSAEILDGQSSMIRNLKVEDLEALFY